MIQEAKEQRTSGAELKIVRARELLGSLSAVLRKNSPFYLVLKTDLETGLRTLTKQVDWQVANEAALLCGDVVHNLRCALDHAFWDLVPAYAGKSTDRAIQFPFGHKAWRRIRDNEAKFAMTAPGRRAIASLRPAPGSLGNRLLYYVHRLDIRDKHKLLIPVGGYLPLSRERVYRDLPGFPESGLFSNPVFMASRHERRIPTFSWFSGLTSDERNVRASGQRVIERRLDWPALTVFPFPVVPMSCHYVQALGLMLGAVTTAVGEMRSAISKEQDAEDG